ncbi:A/G-specific adenine glycosylase [uncultured Bifidobacterium sp.]|uniref:A/G-specific adenine glycosylase n=1 Tax=uncultured Bifidobacterium sp. TaxID=165187 RepID=UPI00259576FA|nr:A/G-specific adenine glycosylase [uncultured Bifidobacterium sp.]
MRVSAAAACRHLAAWWELNARDLPWRFGRTTPWGVLVSEVMSQQTQMSRVVPYWESWMAVWPDAAALAVASTAEVITAWGRLGYPRRALRLQECARVVAEEYANELPHTYEELVALPGVGDYTASAVLSFAFGERVAVIDTNIRRVLSRVFLGVESRGGAASRAERELAGRVLPEEMPERDASGSSAIWNQAVMELGATVCTAKAPQCGDCPLRGECAFLAAGLPGLGERRTRPRQRFQGTDRQVRGIILNALRQAAAQAARGVADGRLETGAPGAVPRSQIEQLWPDHVQLDACIASLDEDGLLDMLPDGSLRLP